MKKILTLLLFLALNTTQILPASAELADEHIEAATGYMNAAQWSYANYEWREALKLAPDNMQANLGLAESLIQSGLLKEAISHLIHVRKEHPRLSLDLLLARAFRQAEDYHAAAAVYREILKRDMFNPQAFRGLLEISPKFAPEKQAEVQRWLSSVAQEAKTKADEAIQAHDYKKAIPFYEIASLFFNTPKALNDYALVLFLNGKNQEAKRHLGYIKAEEGKLWQVHANAAMVALSLGKHFEARQDMEKAIQTCEDPRQKALLYNNLGYIYEQDRRFANARFAYEKAVELNPVFTKAQLNLAYVAQKDRFYDKAVDVYKQILARDPKNLTALTRLGLVYELQHRQRQAMSTYRRAITLHPEAKEPYYYLATLYKKMNKMKESAAEYKKVMELEFKEIESAKADQAQKNTGEQSKILEFIDVFFMEFAS